MMKIIIKEHPFFGHGTVAKHEYGISEGLSKITYDRYNKLLTISFDSCEDAMELKVDDLREITIEKD